VYCRILSRESNDLGAMADSGNLLKEIWFSWDVRLIYTTTLFRCSVDTK
jgi:hypothetical protein